MKPERQAIADLLKNDETLTNLLALNTRWDKPSSQKDRKWSILPGSTYTDQATPFLQLSASTNNRIGIEYREAFFLVRCYNSIDKSYVAIDEILSRVIVLLHRHHFTTLERANIETLWETTSDELVDQAYNLRFREARFQMQLV